MEGLWGCLCCFFHSTSPEWDALPVAKLPPAQLLGSFEVFKPSNKDKVKNPIKGGNIFVGSKVMTLWPLKCLNLTRSLGVWQRERNTRSFSLRSLYLVPRHIIYPPENRAWNVAKKFVLFIPRVMTSHRQCTVLLFVPTVCYIAATCFDAIIWYIC